MIAWIVLIANNYSFGSYSKYFKQALVSIVDKEWSTAFIRFNI